MGIPFTKLLVGGIAPTKKNESIFEDRQGSILHNWFSLAEGLVRESCR